MKLITAIFTLLFCTDIAAKVIEIKHKDIQGRVGLHHVGSCEKHPTLLIEQIDKGSLTTSVSGPPKLSEFMAYAIQAANIYSKNCPDISTIRFAITPMPEEFQCAQGNECFIEFDWQQILNNPRNRELRRAQEARRLPNNHAMESSLFDVMPDHNSMDIARRQFAYRMLVPAIVSANDMTEVLAAGRFDIIRGNNDQNYSGLFSYYFSNFIVAYSEYCSEHIKNPIQITKSFDKYEYNSIENRTEVTKDKNPLIFNVEASIERDFDNNYSTGMYWAFGESFAKIANNNIQGAMKILAETSDQIGRFIAKDCTSDHLKTVYQNMLAFSREQPPITGKYTTNKALNELKSHQPNSAPEFVKNYIKERERLISSKISDVQKEREKLLSQKISFSHISDLNELELAAHHMQNKLVNYMMMEASRLHREGKASEGNKVEKVVNAKIQELNSARNSRRAELMKRRK